MVYLEAPLMVMEVSGVKRSGGPTTHGVDTDENGVVVTREGRARCFYEYL